MRISLSWCAAWIFVYRLRGDLNYNYHYHFRYYCCYREAFLIARFFLSFLEQNNFPPTYSSSPSYTTSNNYSFTISFDTCFLFHQKHTITRYTLFGQSWDHTYSDSILCSLFFFFWPIPKTHPDLYFIYKFLSHKTHSESFQLLLSK